MRNLAAADALAILDCCFASTAAFKGRNEEFRTYQLLAASSPNNPTRGPGAKSFTTALCDSLEELLIESKDSTFPVIKLWERINSKRKTEASLIWDRLQRYKRNIELGRLASKSERDASFQREDPEQASLVLRFSLKTRDLEDGKIEKFGHQLPKLCKEVGIPVRRMEWVKLEQRRPSQIFKDVVKQTVRRNVNVRKTSAEHLQPQRRIPNPKKRSQSDTSSLVATKRRAVESPASLEERFDSGLRTPPNNSLRTTPTDSEGHIDGERMPVPSKPL